MPRYEKEILLEGKNKAELYKKISAGIEELLAKFQLASLTYDRLEHECAFEMKHTHFKARLEVHEERLVLEGDLSWVASAFRSRIDSSIEQWVRENLTT